jgi:hypothetical protein
MTKLIMVVFGALAIVQLIRPVGLPGLKKRSDAWKLAIFGFLATVAATIIAAGLTEYIG